MASSSAAPLFISASDVRELVTMSDLVQVLGPAFQWFSAGDGGVVQPVRATIPVQEHDGSELGHWIELPVVVCIT